jgi:hypothetical protein
MERLQKDSKHSGLDELNDESALPNTSQHTSKYRCHADKIRSDLLLKFAENYGPTGKRIEDDPEIENRQLRLE